MKPIGLFYATREGQTKKIALYLTTALRRQGLSVDVRDLAVEPPPMLDGYAAAILAASVHLGKHEREMVRFARAHRDELVRLPSAFISVSMSEAGVEKRDASPTARAQAVAHVQEVVAGFVAATGWTPARVLPVAGALAYSRYNFLVRWVMKRIAKKEGVDTDTTHDHEYTDWDALDRFAHELVTLLPQEQPSLSPVP
jgi:menaquinone-dependent protoporphyrinogen oxidase